MRRSLPFSSEGNLHDYGGLALTAVIDTATDLILRYHMNFGAQHGD